MVKLMTLSLVAESLIWSFLCRHYIHMNANTLALIMTFASFIPILLYAPYAIYKQGWDSLIPTKDWGKSRAEMNEAIGELLSKFSRLGLISENPAYVGDKTNDGQSAL